MLNSAIEILSKLVFVVYFSHFDFFYFFFFESQIILGKIEHRLILLIGWIVLEISKEGAGRIHPLDTNGVSRSLTL